MKIDIVIATYKREQKLKRCLCSILDNSYLKTTFYRIFIESDYNRLFVFGIWNKYIRTSTADIIFWLNDDIKLFPDCIEKAVKCMVDNFPDTDGMVTLNQSNMEQGRKGGVGLVGRKFADRFPERRCFCPDYKIFHADAELQTFAESINKFKYGEDAKVTHYHPALFKNEMDDTHINSRKQNSSSDLQIWRERKADGLLWGRDSRKLR